MYVTVEGTPGAAPCFAAPHPKAHSLQPRKQGPSQRPSRDVHGECWLTSRSELGGVGRVLLASVAAGPRKSQRGDETWEQAAAVVLPRGGWAAQNTAGHSVGCRYTARFGDNVVCSSSC